MPNCMITGVLTHKSTLIIIESGYFSFCQKTQYYWAFQSLRPISDLPWTGLFFFYVVFMVSCQFLGSLEYWVGSLDLWVGSLDYWVVRWNIAGFVGLLGSSLACSIWKHGLCCSTLFYWRRDSRQRGCNSLLHRKNRQHPYPFCFFPLRLWVSERRQHPKNQSKSVWFSFSESKTSFRRKMCHLRQQSFCVV